MTVKAMPMTRDGRARFSAELDHLRNVRRPEVAQRIHEARDEARQQNNADYEDAKNEQSLIEGRIRELEELLSCAILIEEHQGANDGCVRVGNTVTVVQKTGSEAEYTIVGSAEANPLKGKISNESPCGRALLGRKIGDEVQVMAPSGAITITVKRIE